MLIIQTEHVMAGERNAWLSSSTSKDKKKTEEDNTKEKKEWFINDLIIDFIVFSK